MHLSWSDHDFDYVESMEKNSKFSLGIIKQIIFDLQTNNISIKEIANKYEWSSSNVYRIKNNMSYYLTLKKSEVLNMICRRDKKNWIKIIDNYSSNFSNPFTVKDIQEEINKKIGLVWHRAAINNLMKSEWWLSYKRISSKPKRFRMENLSASRVLFCAKFLDDLTESTFIIKIDETIFNRNWKTHYSWGLKDIENECQNENIVNSVNKILVLCSNGSWVSLNTNENINSK